MSDGKKEKQGEHRVEKGSQEFFHTRFLILSIEYVEV